MNIQVGTTVTASIENLRAQSWFDGSNERPGFEKEQITVVLCADGWFRFRGETTIAMHQAARKIALGQ